MALDHPDRVEKLAVLDIVPAHYLYNEGLTKEFVDAYFHWFLYIRPAPFPENIIAEQKASRPRPGSNPVVAAEYQRTFSNPATIHAMCEDYRASASIDLEFDEADMHRKIECPMLVLWAENGAMGRLRLADPDGRLHIEVQAVRHESRVHLDIETDDIEAEVRRLEALGAKRVEKYPRWWVMEAPTGQRFCVVRPQSESFAAEANPWE